jgi:hypothetical protein
MEQLRSIHIVLFLLVMPALKPPGVSGQRSPFDPDMYKEASLIREHVEVFTDRSLYAVNERIHFRADLFVEGLPEDRNWSSILYVELVSASGINLARAKFDLSDLVCQGSLPIPSSVLSGNYFLKCYTRWMRNTGPGNYSYTPLKIINPFRIEVANQTGEGNQGIPYTRRVYKPGLLRCSIPDTSCERGEEIRLELSGPGSTNLQKVHCCITVVPLDAVDTQKGQLTFGDDLTDNDDFAVDFLPDLYGPSISGTVIRTDKNDRPVQNTRLHFSLLGDKPDYFVTQTDAFGKFVVSMPARTGLQELFVTPDDTGDEALEVRIDQDFDAGFPAIPAVPFTLTHSEREVATRIARMMQLSEAYNKPDLPEVVDLDSLPIPFYGRAIQPIELDDFVDLPSLEEVFMNLVPSVYVIRRKDRTTLKIRSDNSSIGIYKSLIMIDQIPVFDQEALISIAPEKIRRIDVIDEIYVKGSVTFGGVINLVTREGNMAGIDLPAGSYFFDFLAFQPEDTAIEQTLAPEDRIPDSRNTLLWIPDLVLESGNAPDIPFKAPDYPGDYVVLVRSVTGPGKVLSATARFTVK